MRVPVFQVIAAGGWFLLALFTGCGATGEGGAPPSLMRPVINNPGDSRIFYRTEESAHVITLLDDGSYQAESTDAYGSPLGSHAGRWTWKKTGTHNAELLLDSNKWHLTFVSPDSAMAVNPAAGGRTFAFQFERL